MKYNWLAHVIVCAVLFIAVCLDAEEGELEGRLRRRVESLSEVGSRVTGYGGCERAAAYLEEALRRLGVGGVHTYGFPVPIPLDEGFWLESAGERVRLYGLWPNLVRTPSLPATGIEGELVYGGSGLGDVEAVDVEGRIVLLEYRSGRFPHAD